MAFGASTIWEVRTTGDDTHNGGGFDPTNSTTFKTDLAATVANTSAPVVSSASYNFVAGDVGAWVFIKSGTSWIPGWYQIVSVATNKATLSAAVGAGYLMDGNFQPNGLTTAAGCATIASPTVGTWGIDYSQQATAQVTYTDLAIGATNTTVTSAGNPFGQNSVGNIIAVTSGVGFTVQRVLIISVSGVVATCDKALGTASSTGGAGRLGGCLASPGLAASLHVGRNQTFIASGTYSITSASTNIAGGCLAPANDGSSSRGRWIGYHSTRYDITSANYNTTGYRPILQSTVNSATVFTLEADASVENIIVDGNAKTTGVGFFSGSTDIEASMLRCKALNCTSIGFSFSNGLTFTLCEAAACAVGFQTSGASAATLFHACYAHGGTGIGFNLSTLSACIDCISASNSGAASDGFNAGYYFSGCVAYGNGRDGFRNGGVEGLVGHITYCDCIAEGNTGKGFNDTVGANFTRLFSCAAYNNGAATSGVYDGTPTALTGSPFTSASTGDFSLNSASGAGGSCRNASLVNTFPGGTAVGYGDLGAIQSGSGSPSAGPRTHCFISG